MKGQLEIVPVSRMDEVLPRALLRTPERIVWEETTAKPQAPAAEPAVEEEVPGLTAH